MHARVFWAVALHLILWIARKVFVIDSACKTIRVKVFKDTKLILIVNIKMNVEYMK